ncbi:thiolase, N-terminal domain protein [Bordetella holmesii 70147]|nr:thiolase, N-terminal domain protein [Bordetella holmesii 70147]
MARNPNVRWEEIDDIIFGCANQAGEDNRNVARMASLLAGCPSKWRVRPSIALERSRFAHPRRAEAGLCCRRGARAPVRTRFRAAPPFMNHHWRFINR